MSLFPDLPGSVVSPLPWEARFRTLVAGPFQNENLVTRATHQFPLHSATLSYFTTDFTNVVRPIIEFHLARRGRYESFTFYDIHGWDASPVGIRWNTVFVGIAPGGTATFDIPARHGNQTEMTNDTNLKVYGDGSLLTINTRTWNGGADGKDRVILSANPSAGVVLTCDFVARRVWNAKFSKDELALQTREAGIYQFEVALVEVP